MKPFASLCVLSYERQGFLAACLESVREAGAPFELIVHDDGSSSMELRDWLTAMHCKRQIGTLIMNARGHNEGVGEAVRKMFAVAQGDLLIKIDQDLVFEEGWLERLHEAFLYPSVGCAGLFKYHHDPVDFEKTKDAQLDNGWWTVEDFVGSAIAIPREVYEMPGIGPIEAHSPAFSEDVGLKERVQGHGWSLVLPDDDLAVNCGFGVGPSTVNLEFDETVNGGVKIQEIHDGPLVYSGVPGERLSAK